MLGFCAPFSLFISNKMNWFSCLIHWLLVRLIRCYKFGEYQFLKLFTPLLQRKGRELLESVGIIVHDDAPGMPDTYKQFLESESGKKSEYHTTVAGLLDKCTRKKYDRLVHIKSHEHQLFARIANQGVKGAGEGYMENLWNICGSNIDDLSELVTRVLENNLMDLYWSPCGIPFNRGLEHLELTAFNLQTRNKAFEVGEQHYDLGNDLYETMLDPWMQYTCGYWKNATNLADAQVQKLELICRKLDLKPGMRVLDIGCGWGTLCKYMAEKYQVQCVGVTVSEEGVTYGRNLCKGFPVEIRLQDYRDLKDETFDRIVSVGMFEHVGYKNYRDFFKICRNLLADNGIFLLHTIGRNHPNIPRSEPWVHKYIFPNGNLPFTTDICQQTQNLFVIEDWHNFGPDYAKTLYSWRENFIQGWPNLNKEKYDERFYRMWIFYLSIARALFQSRRLQVWQVVLSKDGLRTGYRAER